MKTEKPAPSLDLKIAAFKAILQGPLVFLQFGKRFNISKKDMQCWLNDAGANLALVADQAGYPEDKMSQQSKLPLLCHEERKMLLGNNTH